MSHFWSESLGQIYPTLARLRDEGLVVAEDREAGQRKRIEYTITPAGRKELAAWLMTPSAPQPVRNELLLKLFLAGPGTFDALLEDVRGQGSQYAAILDRYPALTGEIEKAAPTPVHERIWKLNLRLGQLVTEARRQWCLEAAEELESLRTMKETP
jgi:DNA-binding PadR family transcriptional regulator